MNITQVGRRWYKVSISEKGKQFACVEVTRHDGNWWNGYKRSYTMTGEGSKKHREQIVQAMESYLGPVERPSEEE